MATVYAAERVDIATRVAVKVLRQARCDVTVKRFLQEARVVARLRDDHIIDVSDSGRDTLADGEPVAYAQWSSSKRARTWRRR